MKARAHVIAELRTKAARFYAASARMSLPGNADFTAEQARLYTACADWLERNGDQEPR